jgi:hypothetical protein
LTEFNVKQLSHRLLRDFDEGIPRRHSGAMATRQTSASERVERLFGQWLV